MPIIYRTVYSSNVGMNYIVDPRAGKDHLYLGVAAGRALIPHNAKNLVQDGYSDIWRGFKYNNTSSNSNGHPISPSYTTSTMYYRAGYMSGGHPRIMPTGGSSHTYLYNDTFATCEGALNHAMSLDDQHQPTTMKHVVKSDGTENLIHQTSTGYNGSYTYGLWHVWEDIKQNQTMHDTDPKAYTHESVSGYRQANMHCYYHEGTNSMIAPLNNGPTTNTNYIEMTGGVHKWPLNISPDDTDNVANYLLDFPGAANGKASHMIGISEIDGNPIFLQTNSLGNHHYAVYKYNPASHTITTLFSYAQTMGADGGLQVNGNGGKRTSSGTYGVQTVCPSKWVTIGVAGTGGYNKRMFFVPNWDLNGRLTPTAIQWDPGADTFELGGNYAGIQTYSGPPIMSGSSGTALTGSDIQDRQLPLGHSSLAGTSLNNTTMFVTEIHGAYHYGNNIENTPTAAMLSFKNISSSNYYLQFLTTFNVAGGAGVADSDTRYRSLLVFQNRGAVRMQSMNFWGKVDVPETIRNFMWLNEERSRLMIIGASNSYIYQFGSPNSSNANYNIGSYGGYDQTSTNYSWTLTATLPGRYTHAAVDKYGRFIFQRKHEYHGTSNGGVMEMYTESTPVTVDFAGNVTTDTVSYTGSNINKTLTVVAYNLFGKRVAASVNLIITGTDMQFDNGTQNKTITTSTSGTVSETVTITGAGTSRISASYGT